MKIIHTADLHLGSKLTSNLPIDKVRTRRLEVLSNFSRLLKTANDTGVSVVLIAGDLFDTRRITKQVVGEVFSALETYPDVTVIYVVGNHETSALKEVVDYLPTNLICIDDVAWQTVAFGDVKITGANIIGSNNQTLYNTLILDKNDKNIVVLHGEIANHKSTMPGEKINLPELKDKNIDYLALGHYHFYETASLDDRGIYVYSGCLEGRGFDETGEKGYVLIDTDNINKPTFVPFAKRQLFEVEVDITGLNTWADVRKKVLDSVDNLPSSGLLKLVLSGKYNYNTETYIYCEALERQLKERFWFAKIKDETEIYYDATDLVNDVGLKSEFLRKINEDLSLNEHDKSEILQLGLKALKGEDL